ncbi:MAG: ABC transporter ATP-binding protein [Betaproteobacteria bacterium]|nr:ABC transporter ATP-binding protein [Betaproteobacteria bacterium]
MSRRTETVLEGERLTKYFGGLPALKDVSFAVAKGEILGLIGPNGAGKSTLLNLVNGIFGPTEGRVVFQGRDLSGLMPHEIAQRGIARVLQTPRSFASMTVRENVAIGASFGGRGRSDRASPDRDGIEFYLDLAGLLDKKDLPVDGLTLQEKRMLELARALAMRPELLLLDEAMSGLNPTEMERAMRLIRRIRDDLGLTIIWVEHVMKAIMGVAERVLVLNFGQLIAVGTPAEVARDQGVIDAYLGRAE